MLVGVFIETSRLGAQDVAPRWKIEDRRPEGGAQADCSVIRVGFVFLDEFTSELVNVSGLLILKCFDVLIRVGLSIN